MKKSIIIVLVIGVIVCGGLLYFFWRYQSQNEMKQSPEGLPANAAKESPRSPQPEEKHLVIKEWNVRFKLSESIEDARVVYMDGKPYGLTTKTAEKIKGCENAEIRSLHRAKIDGDIAYGYTVKRALDEKADWMIKVGDYYYALFGTGWSCTQDITAQKKIMGIVRKLNDAFINSLERAN